MNSEAQKALTGSDRFTSMTEPLARAVEESAKARGEVTAAERGMQSQREATRARDVAGVEQTFARQVREAPQRAEIERVSARMEEPFIPTRDNATSLASIFALTNIAGFALGSGGKRNAQAAMSAMNGMLEGFQQGRMDLYKKEKDLFDTNMKQLKMRYDTLDRQLREALETYKTDKQAGLAQAEVAYAEAGADFQKRYAEKYGLAAAYEFNQQALNNVYKALQAKEREEDRAERLNRAARAEEMAARREERAEARFEKTMAGGAGAGAGAGTRVGVSGPGGAVQFRYNQAMTNAGLQLAAAVGNLADIPMKSAPPLLAETLTNPTKGISDAVVQFLGQKITQEDSRAMQQILAGMSRAITTIEASGRPSGATEASIKEFGKVSPRAGDSKINYYLFLAESKQVMEILVKDLIAAGANKEQIDFASKARDEVSKVVTWNVKDINRILASGRERLVNDRVREQLQTSDRLSSINRMVSGMERSAATPSAAPATPAAPAAAAPTSRKEKARPGEQIFEDASGNKAVKRNNQWVEVE